jgi:tripartite-type tricarboxylate transporter receptor subunit TctC
VKHALGAQPAWKNLLPFGIPAIKGAPIPMLKSRITLALVMLALLPAAMAQGFPTRAVQIVIAAPPGGPSDVMARYLAQQLSMRLGRQFVVDNRPGANGAIAGDVVAKAEVSGHLIMLAAASVMAVNPHLNPQLQWHPMKHFTPIVQIGTTPLAIGVSKASPMRSLADLVAAARKKPGSINFAAQTGSMPQLAAKMLEAEMGAELVHVPFRGGGQMHAAVLSNDVEVIIDGITPLIPHFKTGAMRPLAVTGETRVEALPEVPTVAEMFPGYESGSWFALFGPAGMDAAAVRVLNEAVNAMIKQPEVRARLVQMAVEPVGGAPEVLQKRLRADYDKLGAVIKRAGIKVE